MIKRFGDNLEIYSKMILMIMMIMIIHNYYIVFDGCYEFIYRIHRSF